MKGLRQQTGVEEALQARQAELGMGLMQAHQAQTLRHHRHPPVPGEGHHLVDTDAAGHAYLQGVLQTTGLHEGDVHQLGRAAQALQAAAEGRRAGIGADEHHGARVLGMQLPGRRLGGGGVALHAGDRYRLQAMAGQGAAGGAQAVLAEGIFLVQHGDPVAISAHQIVNDPVDFGLVAGPQVEHHRPEGLPQQAGAGEGGHQRNQGLLHQGQDRLHRRRSHVAEQGKVALLSDQLARVAQCQRRFVTVIAPSR
jgi:hypothetical protein